MKAKQQRRVICGRILITLVIIAALGCSHEILAQQWTTNGNDISNTNSGNVGVGTTTPWNKLTVLVPTGVRSGITVAGEGNTWVYTDLNLSPIATGIGTGKPTNFAWSVRKDAFYGGDSSGPSLVMEVTRQGGGVFVPFIINPNGNLIFAGATNATNGNVGIGTTNPTSKLHIFGGNVFHQFSATGGQEYGFFTAIRNNHFSSNLYYDGLWKMLSTGKGAVISTAPLEGSGSAFSVYADNTSRPAGSQSTLTNLFNITMDGNAGIGTMSPSHRLDVQGGQINSSGGLCIAGDCKTAWSQIGSSQWTTSGSNIFYNGGNVGIGTSSPTQKLEVNGSALIGTIYGSSAAGGTLTLQSTSHTTKGTIQIGVDQTTTTSIGQSGTAGNKLLVATDRLIVNNAGVRINGAADNGDLSVTKVNISNTDALHFRTTSPNITSNGSISFTANNINGDNVRFNVQNSSVSNAFVIDTNGQTPARLFDVRDLGNSRFTVTGAGDVGVGTTSPTAKLHVAGDGKVTGNLTVDGNIAAKYQDVAEWVPAERALPPGTVVTLNPTQSNLVEASAKAYDTRVAGVISAQPGITLGESGENKVLVATTGRVKVKVDATSAPIHIGDLLVTSDTPGMAMKSEPIAIRGRQIHAPGTLIGKALEPLMNGRGEILVLLSLQ